MVLLINFCMLQHYVLEIDIREEGNFEQLLQARKTFNEFMAFHQALQLKFKTLAFVAMPPKKSF